VTINGVYGFVYSGANGLGIGVFRVHDTQVIGHDYAGVVYRGAATPQADGSIDLDLRMQVPAGVELVQGTSGQEIPYQRQIKHRCPPAFGDGEPMRISGSPGEIIVMIKRVPDEFEGAATGGFTMQTAAKLAGQ
jgi:hypothetical protein